MDFRGSVMPKNVENHCSTVAIILIRYILEKHAVLVSNGPPSTSEISFYLSIFGKVTSATSEKPVPDFYPRIRTTIRRRV